MVYIIIKHEQYPQFVNKFIDIVAMSYRELDGNITVCQRRIFSHVNVQYLEMLKSLNILPVELSHAWLFGWNLRWIKHHVEFNCSCFLQTRGKLDGNHYRPECIHLPCRRKSKMFSFKICDYPDKLVLLRNKLELTRISSFNILVLFSFSRKSKRAENTRNLTGLNIDLSFQIGCMQSVP